MEVSINNRCRSSLNERTIIKLVSYFVKLYKIDSTEMSIAFVGDRTMRRLNFEYRGIDKSTDVLSFEGEGNFLGELIIDINKVKKQKPFYSKNYQREVLFIILHGLLHLIGFEDDKDSDRMAMIDRGKKILDSFLKLNK